MLQLLVNVSGEFMPNKSLFQRISKSTCSLKSLVGHCENLMFQMTGPATTELNQSSPPLYNLSRVNAPVYLYWSDKDWLADKQDIKDGLVAKIPSKYLKQNNELENFNHFDFIWGTHAADQIYRPIARIIQEDQTATFPCQQRYR
ncbi:unnamed protein product [Gongylonema pulchrum]|uniref:Uncharacterized protein n=1 Tax=Gongylonema pulchrum TaxID=637853 RepID=A0A3P7MQ62_9BILA|nr:unnamed protein product [Gongylonema pulchrum]